MENKTLMLKYVRPSIISVLLLQLALMIPALCLLHITINKISAGTASSLEILLGVVFCGVAVFFALKPLWDYRKMMKFLTNNELLDEVATDFASAQSFFEDRIRMGDKYIFGEACCAVLRYTDIVKVYQQVHKQKRRETNRTLWAVDTYGKKWAICKLRPHSIFSEDTNRALISKESEILNFMLSKNRGIREETA